MTKSKHQYFHKGIGNQKRASIVVDLRRPPLKKMDKWTAEERATLADWIKECERSFGNFIATLNEYTNGAEQKTTDNL